MSAHFTHLHLHTDSSLLDGAITIERLIEFCKKNQFKAIGMSDHGNIFGAVRLFQQAKKAGIKPILGMEAYFTEDIRVKNAENKYYHLVLIVENQKGYQNLCQLIHYAYTTGFYFKPRIDYALLEAHSEGLIALSACLGGHIPTLLMQEKYTQAEERVDWFLRVFGRDRFFLEVQPPDQQEQRILNERIFSLAHQKGVRTVATADAHYIAQEDREAHEVMLAIQTHHKMTDPNRFTFGDCRAYLRTQEEMLSIFSSHPDAVWASGEIADRCTFNFETGKLFFPQYAVPEPFSLDAFFKKLCCEGLDRLFAEQRIPEYQTNTEVRIRYEERLSLEVDLIIKMGFVGYFLVVSDFIRWAKKQGIPVGPGRGSAAGSLVAWALQITDIDPIAYNLLFERFLNPERITMPDIDIDFCIEGREQVINYVRDTYGHDKVCQIITFGTMMAKGVVKDVARALGLPFEDAHALTDLIPEQLKITLEEACEQEPRLKELREHNPKVAHLFDIALKLEGITRHASKHAAGIVISPSPICEVLPVYIPPKSNDLVTQYSMNDLEYLGYLKMDFLGLKNLTLIKRVIDLVQKAHGISVDIERLPLDDDRTYALLNRGDTAGVFQLESDGIKDVLRRLQPKKFEDIIAVNALYRPGPIGSGMVDDFIERRHGRQKITYLFSELGTVLEETYGTIVYQEQVMKIASVIAGYSLGEADILRRAMGKKKAEVMAEQRALFVNKSGQRGFDVKKAGELFDLIAYFAGYGFNKSHSAAYALIAYQTAYLKAHFKPEFMACLISLEAHDPEKMAFYLAEAREHGCGILPPDINQSEMQFTVEGQNIRFGLQGIKNVGEAALEVIMRERLKGAFLDLYDFCMRVDTRTVNKRVVESLIYAGAFDKLPGTRAQKIAEIGKVIDITAEKKRVSATGQLGLFDTPVVTTTVSTGQASVEYYSFQPIAPWTTAETLAREKEVLGLYVSAQPLDSYRDHLQMIKAQAMASLHQQVSSASKDAGTAVICGGVLKIQKAIVTKKGDKMAFAQLEDTTGKIEVVLFPKLYEKIQPWLSEHSIFAIKGILDTERTSPTLKAQACIPLELVMQGVGVTGVTISLGGNVSPGLLSELKDKCIKGSIPLSVCFTDQGKPFRLDTRMKIALDDTFVSFIKDQQCRLFLEL